MNEAFKKWKARTSQWEIEEVGIILAQPNGDFGPQMRAELGAWSAAEAQWCADKANLEAHIAALNGICHDICMARGKVFENPQVAADCLKDTHEAVRKAEAQFLSQLRMFETVDACRKDCEKELEKVKAQRSIVCTWCGTVIERTSIIERDVAACQEHDQGCAKNPMKADRDALRIALCALMKFIDDGFLIRDISHDHEEGWALRQLPFVKTLQDAKAALGGKHE